jgi:hypothetical protein
MMNLRNTRQHDDPGRRQRASRQETARTPAIADKPPATTAHVTFGATSSGGHVEIPENEHWDWGSLRWDDLGSGPQ